MSFMTRTLVSLPNGTTEMVAADDFDREVIIPFAVSADVSFLDTATWAGGDHFHVPVATTPQVGVAFRFTLPAGVGLYAVSNGDPGAAIQYMVAKAAEE